MQVLSVRDGFARVAGRGEEREVDTALVGAVLPGQWLLVFLDAARECLDEARAREVDATLDLLQDALAGRALDDPAFTLPSAMSAEQLAQLAGTPPPLALETPS
jgi:hydrogenase expression/formation protein HypC